MARPKRIGFRTFGRLVAIGAMPIPDAIRGTVYVRRRRTRPPIPRAAAAAVMAMLEGSGTTLAGLESGGEVTPGVAPSDRADPLKTAAR